MRQSLKRRIYARGRPHLVQRFRTRTSNLRFFSRAIMDFLAMMLLSSPYGRLPRFLNGIPNKVNKRRPSSSLMAVVTIVISMPRRRSILS